MSLLITGNNVIAAATGGVLYSTEVPDDAAVAELGDFDDTLVATAAAFSDVFAEAVTYKPNGGLQRSIRAIVTRELPGPLGDAPHGHSPLLQLDVENNSTTGIATSEVNLGKDLVHLIVRFGDPAQDRRITAILNQDAGRVVYEIR